MYKYKPLENIKLRIQLNSGFILNVDSGILQVFQSGQPVYP